MQFMNTVNYSRASGHGQDNFTIPEGWERCWHPNGDVYYYNKNFRLVTPENICDPTMLEYVLEARSDHLRCLQGDGSIRNLPGDWELTLTEVTDDSAVVGMFSRSSRSAYDWTEERGLRCKISSVYFWSHVAEYPSHHAELPPEAEAMFVRALTDAQNSDAIDVGFPFSRDQINQIFRRYEHLKQLQLQGHDVVPAIGWLIGAVMPLDVADKPMSDDDLQKMFARMWV